MHLKDFLFAVINFVILFGALFFITRKMIARMFKERRDKTLGQRRTILEKTQDVGQCLIDLYDTDFYDAYCVLSEIQKLVRADKDEAAWKRLLELATHRFPTPSRNTSE